MSLGKLVPGFVYPLEVETEIDGVPVDFRVTKAILICEYCGAPANRIELRHLGAGNPDRSINAGAAVRWVLDPATTATMQPGEWKFYHGNGTVGVDAYGPGPVCVTVDGPPGGPMPLT